MIWSGTGGAHYAFDDQVSGGAGARSVACGGSGPAGVFECLFAQGVYSAPIVYTVGVAPVPQNGLPRHRGNGARVVGTPLGLESQIDTALLHLVLRRKTTAKKRALDGLLAAVFERADALGLIDERPEGSIDATGLESRYASAHYLNRRDGPGAFVQRHWPKLTLVCHAKTYLFAGVVVSRGPSNDVAFLKPAMSQAAEHISFDRLLADKGYDAEYAHEFCRDDLGIRSTIIPLNPRRFKGQLPKTKYRRQMFTRFHNRLYGHRWHVESAISQTKRRLGSALRARGEQAQQRECHLRALTHNLMILKPLPTKPFNRAGRQSNGSNCTCSQDGIV